jgi:ribosome-associated heat shock protein Hsp15
MADKIRVDKWLWGVRIFKSRTIATDVCKSNKVKLNGAVVKPSALVGIGDMLEVKKENFNMQYKVLGIVQTRVSAALAVPCYENLTPEDELKKFDSWFLGQSGNEHRDKGVGRPTKKDRREIDDFKEI